MVLHLTLSASNGFFASRRALEWKPTPFDRALLIIPSFPQKEKQHKRGGRSNPNSIQALYDHIYSGLLPDPCEKSSFWWRKWKLPPNPKRTKHLRNRTGTKKRFPKNFGSQTSSCLQPTSFVEAVAGDPQTNVKQL